MERKKWLLDWTTFNSISLKRFHFDCLHYFICSRKYLCEWTLFAASHKDSIFLWMRPLDVPNIFVIKNRISATLNLISFCKFTHFNAFYFRTGKAVTYELSPNYKQSFTRLQLSQVNKQTLLWFRGKKYLKLDNEAFHSYQFWFHLKRQFVSILSQFNSISLH